MKLPFRAKVFIGLLVVFCFASLVYAVYTVSPPTADQLAIASVFVILAILSEIYATWIPPYKWEISGSMAICLAALFMLGPSLGVLLVFVSSLLSEVFLRWDQLRQGYGKFIAATLFNTSQLTVAMTVAGLTLRFSNHQVLLLGEPSEYLWAIAGSLFYLLLNTSSVIGIVCIIEKKKFLYPMWTNLHEFFVQYFTLCSLALLLTVLYSISIWHVLLGLIPVVLVHVSFGSYLRLQTETRKTFEQISRLLDERDHYTAVHSTEVAELATRIAQEMGLSQRDIERTDIAARVHDIGKIAVPDSILLKPGPLTEEEWKIMKLHPAVSAELIEGLEIYAPVANAVRHEHERWNGKGYPDGLRGEAIPFVARIIAAADIYNALSTDRPYRKAFSRQQAIEIVKQMRGVELDPAVADALIRVISGQKT